MQFMQMQIPANSFWNDACQWNGWKKEFILAHLTNMANEKWMNTAETKRNIQVWPVPGTHSGPLRCYTATMMDQ